MMAEPGVSELIHALRLELGLARPEPHDARTVLVSGLAKAGAESPA
jgi:hypothetical protein